MIKEELLTLNGGSSQAVIPNGNKVLYLENGNILLHFSKGRETLLGAYMITYFRDGTNRYEGQCSTPYCSLVNLADGNIEFQERCSRETTMGRVLSHLHYGDFNGAKALEQGEFVEMYRRGKVKIDLSFDRRDNKGWKNE